MPTFLLQPQYWAFEALTIFILALLFFHFFLRSREGKRIARAITLHDDAQAVVEDAQELRDRAAEKLGEAEQDLAVAHANAQELRGLAGVPDGQPDDK